MEMKIKLEMEMEITINTEERESYGHTLKSVLHQSAKPKRNGHIS